jgi:hypothetical protein
LLRYLSPVFWAVALLANVALALQGRYLWLLTMQLVLLLSGLLVSRRCVHSGRRACSPTVLLPAHQPRIRRQPVPVPPW